MKIRPQRGALRALEVSHLDQNVDGVQQLRQCLPPHHEGVLEEYHTACPAADEAIVPDTCQQMRRQVLLISSLPSFVVEFL
eukprot:CAMPEP_0114616890 /NCGR_PEP_ID=MMETSP0168-20121206/6918_1 /TAXON_ID=95228 ORGANISM="Vannella sp., Strain DIVA3 517/6/12" /NCGR_SAMPLE_ID=MMETSP0168 /ASSEMBLY_ACC=CAM_ASM_000044 /LENGTH=80 /DNA_ID=CAMNT_0001828015 /DNA_START=369 /DNA_END=608 /DNA_ORIENTATION=+